MIEKWCFKGFSILVIKFLYIHDRFSLSHILYPLISKFVILNFPIIEKLNLQSIAAIYIDIKVHISF